MWLRSHFPGTGLPWTRVSAIAAFRAYSLFSFDRIFRTSPTSSFSGSAPSPLGSPNSVQQGTTPTNACPWGRFSSSSRSIGGRSTHLPPHRCLQLATSIRARTTPVRCTSWSSIPPTRAVRSYPVTVSVVFANAWDFCANSVGVELDSTRGA